VVWGEASVSDLTQEQIGLIAEEFGLDPLAVEDSQEINHRVKLEPYETHLLVVIQQLDEMQGQLETKPIYLFVGANYVLALHHDARRLLNSAKSRWQGPDQGESERGPADLLYVLLDTLVDDYQVIADRLEQEVEELEESALARPTNTGDLDRRLYRLKQQLSRLRRYAMPGGRVLDQYVQNHSAGVATADETRMFRDVHDNLMRVNEQIHNVDDLANAILDLRRADQTAGRAERGDKEAHGLGGDHRRAYARLRHLWDELRAGARLGAGVRFLLRPHDHARGGHHFVCALQEERMDLKRPLWRRAGWIYGHSV
jgi:magnesium transporter